ncbi:MAG: hypothetical protein KDD47_14680 [Acidobacteria bacterium]|nr:hypothetical protein [Acidobacteriota bacterium]
MDVSAEIDRILDEAREVTSRAKRQRELAAAWPSETLAGALEQLRPFLAAKLGKVQVLADGLALGEAALRFAIRPGPPLGTVGVVPSLEVVASVDAEVGGLATDRLAISPLEDATRAWVQLQVLVFLRRIAPHLVERPQ